MAFNIHWKIQFKSLRSGTLYTVSIYKDGTLPSGYPLTLKGGAQPFVTQESNDDDPFIPVRSQTGYLRFVDDGTAEKANGTTLTNWDWKEILPNTDTDRPVTLTDDSGNVVWQGFMQAQNFSGTLYGNPQEREFPIQCALTILEGTDINYQQTDIQNFAYLLQRIVNCVDVVSGGTENGSGIITANGNIHINEIWVQGGTDAQAWLLKRIDWQNFVSIDNDGNISARYNLYQCLEDMCRFWGWTARTYKNILYLTCACDSAETYFLKLTRANLDTMAVGSTAGTTNTSFPTVSLSGDIFANNNNGDFRQRGPNKATVKADGNATRDPVIRTYPDKLVKEMGDSSWYLGYGSGGFGPGGNVAYFSSDKTSFSEATMLGECRSTYASFNIMRVKTENSQEESHNVIRILKAYSSSTGTAHASLQTKYAHLFGDCVITVKGTIFRNCEKFEDYNDGTQTGNKHMYIRIGIGKTRSSAIWCTLGGLNMSTWSNSVSAMNIPIGGQGQTQFMICQAPSTCEGHLYIDFLGSSDMEELDGARKFEIAGLEVLVERNNMFYEITSTSSHGNFASLVEKELVTSQEYKSSNANNVRDEWNADCPYGSDNNMNFGFGVLGNADGTYFKGYNYGGLGLLTYSEQHLANLVTSFWASAKRKIEAEIRADQIAEVTPSEKVTLDGTTGYPIMISREWRDDIVQLIILQL